MPLVRQHLAGSADLGHSRIDAGAAAGQGWNENRRFLSPRLIEHWYLNTVWGEITAGILPVFRT